MPQASTQPLALRMSGIVRGPGTQKLPFFFQMWAKSIDLDKKHQKCTASLSKDGAKVLQKEYMTVQILDNRATAL
jgi:hypothetical protein